MMERLTIGDVSRRSGISIRMLRHYDAIGLVQPERGPNNGYRHYRPDDVVRIQAIVALRQLGFGLREIGDMLTPDRAPFTAALQLRAQAIEREIADRVRVHAALQRMIERLTPEAAPSLDDVFATLQEMTRMERVNRYYTDEQLAELRDRADALGEAGMQKAQDDWTELMADVRAMIDTGVDVSDPRAREAADRWDALIAAFTGGNEGIASNLNRVWENESEIEGTDMQAARELGAWIERVRKARPA